MNTCEMLCAACIGGVWLALTAPRQMKHALHMPLDGVRGDAEDDAYLRVAFPP